METPTPSIPVRRYDDWVRLYGGDKTSGNGNGNGTHKESQTRPRFSLSQHSVAYARLDDKIRQTIAKMTKSFTIGYALTFVRALVVFVFTFASMNIIFVLWSQTFDGGTRALFMRFGMTVPASLCAMCNGIGIFLLSHLVEKLYVRSHKPNS